MVVLYEDDREREVELDGIDAFELGQVPAGEKALERLRSCVGHHEGRGTGSWGRDYMLRKGYPELAYEKGALGGLVFLRVMREDEQGRLIAYVYGASISGVDYFGPDGPQTSEQSCNRRLVHGGLAYRTEDDPHLVEADERQGKPIRELGNLLTPFPWREISAQDDLP